MAHIHILMATYNGEKYIREQLDSIIRQTYTDWELFISDDCSTDGTLTILEEYEKNYAGKITVINKTQKFGSAKENFRYLYEACPPAEYYMFSDQDDVWLQDKIQKLLQFYESHITKDVPGLVYCDLEVVDKNLNKIADSFMDYQNLNGQVKDKSFILKENYIPGCVMLYSDALRRMTKHIPKECYMHDWWLTLTATYFGQIYFLNESLNMYRQHDENVIGSHGIFSWLDEFKNIVNGLFHNPVKRTRNLLKSIKESLNMRVSQAASFKEIYQNKIDRYEQRLIEEYVAIGDKHHKVKAVRVFLKYHKDANFVKKMYYILAIVL